jgi:outer membrane protein assembly factor BamB
MMHKHIGLAIAAGVLVAVCPAGPARAIDTPTPLLSYRVSADSAGNVRHTWEHPLCDASNGNDNGHVSPFAVMIVRYSGAAPTFTDPTDGHFYPVNGGLGNGTVVFRGCEGPDTADPPRGCMGRNYFVDKPGSGTFTYAAYPWKCVLPYVYYADGGIPIKDDGGVPYANACCTDSATAGCACHDSSSCSSPNPAYNNNSGANSSNAARITRTVTIPAGSPKPDWMYSSNAASLGNPAGYRGVGVLLPQSGSGVMDVFGDTGAELWGPPTTSAEATHTNLNTWPMIATLSNGSRVVFGVSSSNNNLYAINARTGDVMWTYPVGAVVTAPPVIRLDKYNTTSLGMDLLYVGTGAIAITNKVYALKVTNTAATLQGTFSGDANGLQQVTGIGIDYASDHIYVSSYMTGANRPSLWCVAALQTDSPVACADWPGPGVSVGDLAAPAELMEGSIWTGSTAASASDAKCIYKVDYAAGGKSLLATLSDGIVSRVWKEWRGSTQLVFVRTGTATRKVWALNPTGGATVWSYPSTGSATSGPVVDGTDGYLWVGTAAGTLDRVVLSSGALDAGGSVAVCPSGVSCTSIGEPMLMFPENGKTRVVVGSSAGYSGRFEATPGNETDNDHDGVSDGPDNCPAMYNPSQSLVGTIKACTTPAVTFTKLDTGVSNKLTMNWWIEGERLCDSGSPRKFLNDCNSGASCGTRAAPVAKTIDFTYATSTSPIAEVSWNDGPNASTLGPIQVAIRYLKPTAANLPTVCSPHCTTCSACALCMGSGGCAGIDSAVFRSFTISGDDGAFTGLARRIQSNGSDTFDGAVGAYNASLLAGPWFLTSQLAVNIFNTAYSCSVPQPTYYGFDHVPLDINQKDAASYWSGGQGVGVTFTNAAPGSRRLDLYFNVPDTLVNLTSCGYSEAYGLGPKAIKIYAGFKGLTGELHFTE